MYQVQYEGLENPIRERPLMTSDIRVGRGVQNDLKNWTFYGQKG